MFLIVESDIFVLDSTYVLWDNGHYNRYQFDEGDSYQIFPTDDHPRIKDPNGDIEIGMTVEKGLNFSHPPTLSTLSSFLLLYLNFLSFI